MILEDHSKKATKNPILRGCLSTKNLGNDPSKLLELVKKGD